MEIRLHLKRFSYIWFLSTEKHFFQLLLIFFGKDIPFYKNIWYNKLSSFLGGYSHGY